MPVRRLGDRGDLPPLIFTAAAILGACRTIELPTLAALLPGVVGTPLLPRAVALSASAMETATILGPALGGLLYLAGPKIAYGIVAVLYAAASLCIWSIKLAAPHVARREPVSVDNCCPVPLHPRQADHPRRHFLDMVAVLLGGATALLPIYARDILHTSSLGLGALRAAPRSARCSPRSSSPGGR